MQNTKVLANTHANQCDSATKTHANHIDTCKTHANHLNTCKSHQFEWLSSLSWAAVPPLPPFTRLSGRVTPFVPRTLALRAHALPTANAPVMERVRADLTQDAWNSKSRAKNTETSLRWGGESAP